MSVISIHKKETLQILADNKQQNLNLGLMVESYKNILVDN